LAEHTKHTNNNDSSFRDFDTYSDTDTVITVNNLSDQRREELAEDRDYFQQIIDDYDHDYHDYNEYDNYNHLNYYDDIY